MPYSYRCTIIKCEHLRTRKECCATGKEPIAAGYYENIITHADLRICRDHMFRKCIFSLCHKLSDIVPDYHPVTGWRKEGLEPSCPFYT